MNDKVNKKSEETKQAAYAMLRSIASGEPLQFLRTPLDKQGCKATGLYVRKFDTEEGQEAIEVTGDKLGWLATFVRKGKKWTPIKGSKLTYEEYETYTDPRVVEDLLEEPATNAAYGESALLPDGLIPIKHAVEIYSRGMGEVHRLITEYLSGKMPEYTLTRKDINKLICDIDDTFDGTVQPMMLTVLATYLGNRELGSDNTSKVPTNLNLLTERPLGADKLVHAVQVSIWVINHEEKILLDGKREALKELMLNIGHRRMDAVDKVVGKAARTKVYTPILSEVAEILSCIDNQIAANSSFSD